MVPNDQILNIAALDVQLKILLYAPIISMEPQDHDKPIIGIRVLVNGLIMILKFYAWNRSISILQLAQTTL